ncbi:MAG: prephenate dehydrogenase/arogenate dehydrogenase family protein [Acidobacteriota bacterium]|nr:MAG: prephenate dehydrogenase/arogenate dehydrogenase family protein [Acidobacteriota bacterium]
MIVVMKERATDRQTRQVIRTVVNWGLDVHRSTGTHHVILGVVGDLRNVPVSVLETMPGVDRLIYISKRPRRIAAPRPTVKLSKPLSVSIVGLGLMGGSLAKALRAQWPGATVVGYVRPKPGRKIPRGILRRVTSDPREAASADLVVFATPIDVTVRMIRAWAKWAKPGSLWTDMGSTKAEVCRAAASALPKHATFVGGHPMTGSEERGIEHARTDLFEGTKWILTPVRGKRLPPRARILRKLATSLGAKTILMNPREHDRIVAATSHLPQLVSTVLAVTTGPPLARSRMARRLVGPGLQGMTRIASSPHAIWRDIFATNPKDIKAAMKIFLKHLKDLETLSPKRIEGAFRRAHRMRRNLKR